MEPIFIIYYLIFFGVHPISVLMVSTEYPPMPGGVGRYTRNLALALKKLGIEVYVACNERGEGDFFGLDASNKENSRILLRIVNQIKPDLVHIQLEHGLYGLNFDSIKKFRMQTNIDQFYEKCQTPTITTFHSAYPIEQWINLVPSNHPSKLGLIGVPIELSSLALKYGNRMVTYELFNRTNREKMLRSAASIAFSEYIARILSTRDYNVNVIYHGAEPSLMNRPTMEVARSHYSLPLDRKIALALGFATHTKGWLMEDILSQNVIDIPTKNDNDDNSVVTGQDLKVVTIFPTKNEESTIENVIKVASTSKFNPEVIIVDAHSSDGTADLAKKAGATVIQQPEQIFPGKGNAMKAVKRFLSETTKRCCRYKAYRKTDVEYILS